MNILSYSSYLTYSSASISLMSNPDSNSYKFITNLVNFPEIQVFSKVHDTNFVRKMEFSGSIEVEDDRKRSRISIEVEFVVLDVVVVAEAQEFLV